jgi:hypothetical protein
MEKIIFNFLVLNAPTQIWAPYLNYYGASKCT